MLSLKGKKKGGTVVGLDIEAGSIAAAEVRGPTARRRSRRPAIEPLAPGAFHEGEVADADSLAEALKSLFSPSTSFPSRCGSESATSGSWCARCACRRSRTRRRWRRRFASRPRSRCRCRSTRRCSSIRWSAASRPRRARRPRSTSSSSPPAATWSSSFVEPLRRAGLEPVGVDLSAFGMIRALAGVGSQPRPTARATQARRSAGAAAERVALLQRRRRHEPRGGARPRLPLHPRLRRRPGGRSAAGSPPSAALSHEHATQWLAHVGLERPVEADRGRPRDRLADARRALEEGVAGLVDELRLSLDYYGAQESAVPVERIVLCGPGSAIPGLAARMEAGLGLPIASGSPARPLRVRRERSAARLDASLRTRAGELRCAPST